MHPKGGGKKLNLGQWPIPSPQLSRCRQGKRPPPAKNRGTARRHASARPEGTGGGGNGHGHFGHLSPPRNGRTGIQSDPVQEPEWPRNRERADEEAVLQRRMRRRWDHDEDVCGCRGRSIHRMTGMGGGLVLSSLLFPPPHLKLPPRDIYICIPHSISTPLSSHRKKNSTLLCVMSLSDRNPEFCNTRKYVCWDEMVGMKMYRIWTVISYLFLYLCSNTESDMNIISFYRIKL